MPIKKSKIIINKNKTSLLELKRELFSLLQKYRIPNKNIVHSKNNDFENIQYFCREIQDALFDLYGQETTSQLPSEKIYKDYKYIPRIKENYFQVYNRRYIGNKHKLLSRIFSIITKECSGNSFADIFSGTGIIAAEASRIYKKIIVNDFLYSNYAIYKAFFENAKYNLMKIETIINSYNSVSPAYISDNYFSRNFGGRFFSTNDAKKIGFLLGII